MKDIPVIFSGPMVDALLKSRKTQTRRLLYSLRKIRAGRAFCGRQLQGYRPPGPDWKKLVSADGFPTDHGPGEFYDLTGWEKAQTGDRMWVKETHYRYGRWVKDGKTKTGKQRWRFRFAATAKIPDNTGVHFPDDPPVLAAKRTTMGWHKRPSIFMPRWASRLTLVLRGIKIEALNAISREDAIAEGLIPEPNPQIEQFYRWPPPHDAGMWLSTPAAYRWLWEQLHGPGSWEINPFVVVLSFTVHKTNIDAMPKAEAA